MGGFDALVEQKCIGSSVVVRWLGKPLTREELYVRHCAALEKREWGLSMAFILSPSPSHSSPEVLNAKACKFSDIALFVDELQTFYSTSQEHSHRLVLEPPFRKYTTRWNTSFGEKVVPL